MAGLMTWLLCLFCGSWTRVDTNQHAEFPPAQGYYGCCKQAECRCQALSMLVVTEKASIASAAVAGPPIPSWAREAFDGG